MRPVTSLVVVPAVVALLGAVACSASDPPSTEPTSPREDASTPYDDGPRTDGSIDDAASSCATGPTVPRAKLVEESVKYLRQAFGVTTGFEGGAVSYGEMWVALDDTCLKADWSSLNYVAPIAAELVPSELRSTHTRVAVVWALNGRKSIAFLESSASTEAGPAPWQAGLLPDNFNVIKAETSSDDAASAFVQQLGVDHPALKIDWLAEIGALTVSATIGEFALDDVAVPKQTVVEIEEAAKKVRQSGLFSALEWSPHFFRLPNEVWPAKSLDGEVLEPECLRVETRPFRDGKELSTRPSLPTPLGPGPTPDATACK